MSQEEVKVLLLEAEKLKVEKGYEEALSVLEKAHLIAQERGWDHLLVHVKMFRLAIEYRMLGEVIGQIPRMLLAVIGSVTGIYPRGNVGSTRMGIFESSKK